MRRGGGGAGPGQGRGGAAGPGRRTGAARGAVGSEGPERERACERDQRESVHVIAHPYSDLGHTAKIFFLFFVFKLIFAVCHRSWHTANK